MKDRQEQLKKIVKLVSVSADKLTIIISLIMIAGSLIFLYGNFYTAVSDANVLLTLKKQVVLEIVDMQAWQKIHKEIEWKKQPLAEDELLRNPFE